MGEEGGTKSRIRDAVDVRKVFDRIRTGFREALGQVLERICERILPAAHLVPLDDALEIDEPVLPDRMHAHHPLVVIEGQSPEGSVLPDPAEDPRVVNPPGLLPVIVVQLDTDRLLEDRYDVRCGIAAGLCLLAGEDMVSAEDLGDVGVEVVQNVVIVFAAFHGRGPYGVPCLCRRVLLTVEVDRDE